MFKKLMNNYYFGKAGKADLTPDDLPTTRSGLFWETLRVRFSQLIRLNLMYVVVWIPTVIVLLMLMVGLNNTAYMTQIDEDHPNESYQTQAVDEAARAAEADPAAGINVPAKAEVLSVQDAADMMRGLISTTMLLLFPCIAITGPLTAGVAYVTRNWSRDEHAFIWSDFKDAVKANWKQSLPVSVITGLMPLAVWTGWTFYGGMAGSQVLMIIPQIILLMVGILWSLAVTYMHPMIVSYQLKLRDVVRNSFLLAVARLPMSVGIRLLHVVPVALFGAVALFLNTQWGVMLLVLYYLLIGFSLSRFVTASYTNAVFDRFINSRIEGAKVNRGLREADDDEDDEDEDDGTEG